LRALSLDERRKIEATLEPVISDRAVSGICAYGSQTAGYARSGSDYDVIVVFSPFRQKIKYQYLKGEIECSALLVEAKSFESDCSKSSLGEFVAGRLLNPYEALAGEDYLRENEAAYKRRVILEGLAEAYAENRYFAGDMGFKLPYFLFAKLKKRASIYRPVIYSYAQTYGPELLAENLETSLWGFREAASMLASERVITSDSKTDSVKLNPQNFKSGALAKLSGVATFTKRGITQYAVHGYAGRVSPAVMGREVSSKLSRSREHSKLPEEITLPKRFWTLPNTRLFAETKDWLSDILATFGLEKETTKINHKALGEIYTSASRYTLENGNKKISLAVKRFADIKSVKWGILNLWSLKNTKFTANSMERMHREYRAMSDFKSMGIHTPEIVAVFLSEKILVTGFVSGRDLSRIQADYLDDKSDGLDSIREFGRILATLHKNAYCMGDTKPSNAVLCDSDSELYLTDLEQAHRHGNHVWDLAEFVYYSVRFTMKEAKARRLVREFVEGYLSGGGSLEAVQDTVSFRYRAPFQTFIAPNVLNAIRSDLAKK
jgi:tRNA A-37 threonylcarbamoyl transferase component Bud32/predicted nucleotidyltransferase